MINRDKTYYQGLIAILIYMSLIGVCIYGAICIRF